MKTFYNILYEAKIEDEYNRKYSSIDLDTFNQIALMDPKTKVENDLPTALGFGSKQFLLPKYMSGETEFISNPDKVKNALTTYYNNIATYPKFNEFNSVGDFLAFIDNPETANIELQQAVVDPIKKIYDKYYSNIDFNTFKKLINIDPQTTDTKIGEIAKNLILPKYISGETDISDDLTNACKLFYDIKTKMPADKRILSAYASIQDFISYVLESQESDLVASLKKNTRIDDQTGRQVKDDFTLIASTSNYDILEPHSRRAAEAIGGGYKNPDGMHWCTGHETTSSYWNSYSRDGRIFSFMNKEHPRGSENRDINWQISIKNTSPHEVEEFLNGHDSPAFPGNSKNEQFSNFLITYPEIFNAIKSISPFDQLNAVKDTELLLKYSKETFIVDSVDAALRLKQLLKTNRALVSEIKFDINIIPVGLCANLASLNNIIFTDKVAIIGPQAFKNCAALTTLNFPESLKVIKEQAFMGCVSLKGSIRLPDSVDEIRLGAFDGCHFKLKVNKDRSNKLKFNAADKPWVNAHVKAIKLD